MVDLAGDLAVEPDHVPRRKTADRRIEGLGAVQGAGRDLQLAAGGGESDGDAPAHVGGRKIAAGGDLDLAGSGDVPDHAFEPGGRRSRDDHAVVDDRARHPVAGQGDGPGILEADAAVVDFVEVHARHRAGVVHLMGVDQAASGIGPGVADRGRQDAGRGHGGAGVDGEDARLGAAGVPHLEDRGGVDRGVSVAEGADLHPRAALGVEAAAAERPAGAEGAARNPDVSPVRPHRGVAAVGQGIAGRQVQIDEPGVAHAQGAGREGPVERGVALERQVRGAAGPGDHLGDAGPLRIDPDRVGGPWRRRRRSPRRAVGPVGRVGPATRRRSRPDEAVTGGHLAMLPEAVGGARPAKVCSNPRISQVENRPRRSRFGRRPQRRRLKALIHRFEDRAALAPRRPAPLPELAARDGFTL